MNPVVVLPNRALPPQYIPTEELPAEDDEDAAALRETIALIVPALAAFSASSLGKLRRPRDEEDRVTGTPSMPSGLRNPVTNEFREAAIREIRKIERNP